jgi:geranylgeranyl diphosphate synthase type I
MKKTAEKTDKSVKSELFIAQLTAHKKLIDADIKSYCAQAVEQTYENFGTYPTEAVKAYCEFLNRGGKRIRGALTMTAYKMLGGTDESIARRAAMAIEMLHAYILIVDDIQDRSEVRRGGPTVHIDLKNYHEKHHLQDDSQHFGESIAINSLLYGVHSAINVLSELDIDAELRLRAIKNVNDHFIATAHGQSLDIFNEVVETADENDVDNVLLWKTAFYTFMNPLQLGAILAGGSAKDLKKLEQYSLSAGRVFQITDDILGIFSEESASGKSPLDDIKEGKRTHLTVKALQLAPKADAYFLEQMLGNKQLTQSEFHRCQEIIEESGALKYAQKKSKDSVVDALTSLSDVDDSWGSNEVEFLQQLVKFLIDRKA